MNLPQPVTTDQQLMAVMCGLLDEQNKLLAEMRDRLPGRETAGQPVTAAKSGGAVDLKEPAASPRAATSLTEPTTAEPSAVDAEPTQETTPRVAKKTTAARRRTAKEKS